MRIRILRISTAALFLVSLLLPLRAAANEVPSVSAEAAAVAEVETGQILFEKNGAKRMKAASTVKILTALVVLERLDPAMVVRLRPEWKGTEGSSMYLRAGETCTVEDLLTGMLLVSGNDAATALACLTAGSCEAFAVMMNEKAASLGMKDSRFSDPCGLSSEEHWVTAADMARLGCAAMKDAHLKKIVSSRTAQAAGRTLSNHNKLLWRCEGAVGVKTGYTKAAGRTLVSCAERGGVSYVCVTLNAPDDWNDHMSLLDWAFSAYARSRPTESFWLLPVVSGAESTVEVLPQKDVWPVLPRSKEAVWSAELPSFVYAPVSEGEIIGHLRCRDADGTLLADIPLVFGSDVPIADEEKLRFLEKLRWAWLYACRHSAARPQFVFY